MRSISTRIAAIVACALLSLTGFAAPAHAAGEVSAYTVEGSVAADGVLSVHAELALTGGPDQIVQRFATTRSASANQQYVYKIEGVKATAGGQPVEAKVATEGDYQVVTIPVAGKDAATLDYTVTGAAVADGGSTTVAWRLLQGLNLPVRVFDATVKTPGPFTAIDCAAGPPANPGNCKRYAGGTHEQSDPFFSDGPRGVGEVVQVELRFPTAVVAGNQEVRRVWTLDHGFSAAPIPLAVALGLAALGALAFWLLHRRFGADAAAHAEPTAVASFEPVGEGRMAFRTADGLRPGLLGTLVDERVDPIDVTATVLDLAVNGHLLIEELPRASMYQPADWRLTQRGDGAGLHEFERTLRDAVAPADGGALLSEAGERVAAAISGVQYQLYGDVVSQGWFSQRPDAVRARWSRIGWAGVAVAVVVAGLLVAFTDFGLVGLVLLGLAAGLMFIGQAMPARTAAGASALNGLGVLRQQLQTQATDPVAQDRPLEELSKVVPYAVVLGGAERWIDALVRADKDADADSTDLHWYHAPEQWHLRDLPDSLRNFVTTLQGTLVSR